MSAQRVSESLARETADLRRLSPILAGFPGRKPLGQIIYDRRIELGIRQLDLGREVGLVDTMIGKIESGVRLPDVKYLPSIARALRIDLAAFSRVYLYQRAPKVYQALQESDELAGKIRRLTPALRRVIAESVDKLLKENRTQRMTA